MKQNVSFSLERKTEFRTKECLFQDQNNLYIPTLELSLLTGCSAVSIRVKEVVCMYIDIYQNNLLNNLLNRYMLK